MDTNRLLVWFTVLGTIANILALFVVRKRPRGRQLLPFVAVYAVLAAAITLAPETAGLFGFVMFLLCVLLPGLWMQLVGRMLVRGHYRTAALMAPWLRSVMVAFSNPEAPLTDAQRMRFWELHTAIAAQRSMRQAPTPATSLLVFCNVVAYLIEIPGGAEDEGNLLHLGGLEVPFTSWASEWWRLITACFLHFGLLHITMNMLALLIFGRFVERRMGVLRCLITYLVSGVAGMAFYALIGDAMQWDPKHVVVGASGCVMAMVGARLSTSFMDWRQSHSVLSRRDLALVGIVVGTQIVFDVLVPEVAMTVHLVGLVLGALLGLAFRRPG